tara:strand:+ start:194 stop:883 length:690 start_codon:yes stop_codon:yes gene_type:complete
MERTIMSVLIGCETSGVSRRAWEAQGFDVVSCDLLPSEDNASNHYICDVMEMLKSETWEYVQLHPTCTALAVSGNAWYGEGMAKNHLRLEAIAWTTDLWNVAKEQSGYVCLENPVGVLSTQSTIDVKPQYIQPWQHGHPESKKTGLWLHELEPLKESNNVKHKFDKLPKREQQRLHWLPPSKDRWKIRSRTYEGIALAIAKQFGQQIKDERDEDISLWDFDEPHNYEGE